MKNFSEKYNTFFVHIPKNAGTSINTALEIPLENRGHRLPSELEQLYVKEYTEANSIAVVRNPYDRLCSAYTDKIVNKTKGGLYSYRSCKDFTEFINAIQHQNVTKCDRHIRLQTSLFPLNINFVGKLENYDKDSKYIFNKFNKKKSEHININSTIHNKYQNLYNKHTQNIVSNMYRDDLNTLNYTYEA